ncbi:MAG: arginine repressor [Clostridiales bacterium]|nr:arginine repressor [Clostridiales bacterium]
MKEERQRILLELIAQEEMETQEQLLQALLRRGIHCTQATVSRDIRELHLVKGQSASGRYCYALPTSEGGSNQDVRLKNIFRECVISFDAAQNIVVLKSMPGLANAAAAALDGMKIEGMVGTLAGDDTAIMIMRTNQAAERFCSELRLMLK